MADTGSDRLDIEQADTCCPTRIRMQLWLYEFDSGRYFAWRGASDRAVVASTQEAIELFERLQRVMHAWKQERGQ